MERADGGPKNHQAEEHLLVVTTSDLLVERVRRALPRSSREVQHAPDGEALARHKRQRPFLVCFLDARGEDGAERVRCCYRARPAERYVLVLEPWQPLGGDLLPEGAAAFGYLREPFSNPEILSWVRRATDELRLLRGDRSLEELLFSRFSQFLLDLGPQSMSDLHSLVLERVERQLIAAVLDRTGGNQSRAADILGIHRNTLRAKIRTLGLGSNRAGEG